jgi:UDP:flavonoid glycosyltransferase YjiC (YdhE family)
MTDDRAASRNDRSHEGAPVPAKKILFFSGSIGLGHIGRDLAIARELRKQLPEVKLFWLAASPADEVIRGAGEVLLPEAVDCADATAIAELSARGARLSLVRYGFAALKAWRRNVAVLKRVMARERFDLLIGDETYEIVLAFKRNPRLKTGPFVMIYDFVGFDSLSRNPMEKLGVYFWNSAWVKGSKHPRRYADLSLFIGDQEDVPDDSFGFMLPNRREWARERYRFVGNVLPFDPADYADSARLRSRLGYGTEPLIVCSIGGTAIGKQLLELCGKAYPILRERIPDLRMVLVGGPRLAAGSLDVPRGVEARGYVPALYEHFAASDLAIVQGGATATLELAALRRPFLYFPIEGHCEQEIQVAARLARYEAGVKMALSRTTPQALSNAVVANIGKKMAYAPIAADGARQAATLICGLLQRNEEHGYRCVQ